MSAVIRHAVMEDVPAMFRLIRELVEHERIEHKMTGTEALLRQGLFGDSPRAWGMVAEQGGEIVGVATFFEDFSTLACEKGVFIEDLYVRADCRGQGIGQAMFEAVRQEAEARGCHQLTWWASNWNEGALRFYRRMGAEPVTEMTPYQLPLRRP